MTSPARRAPHFSSRESVEPSYSEDLRCPEVVESQPVSGGSQLSKLIETKAEFQALAETRLLESKALLDLGMWDGAYYLAGYAVELALKACIIKTLMTTDAFPDKEFSKNCYTHVIDKLVGLARLESTLKLAMNADTDLVKELGNGSGLVRAEAVSQDRQGRGRGALRRRRRSRSRGTPMDQDPVVSEQTEAASD